MVDGDHVGAIVSSFPVLMCFSVEGVRVGSYHHHDLLEGIGASSEFSPVHAVLIAAAVVPSPVPHAVQI